MAWDYERARSRIMELQDDVPAVNVVVENFAEEYFPRHEKQRSLRETAGLPQRQPIIDLPYKQAIVVDGVHIYSRLLDFDRYLLDDDSETEASHRRALQVLHLHYSACDRLIEQFNIQRVDYHGARLHAVVVTPTGSSNESARVSKALEFATALHELARETVERLDRGDLSGEFRTGIDTGVAVAINDGRGIESDPLFLGHPANEAAKISEYSNDPGIYLSSRAQSLAAGHLVSSREGFGLLTEAAVGQILRASTGDGGHPLLEEVRMMSNDLLNDSDLMSSLSKPARFVFHNHSLPMRTLRFEKLSPSNSVRMCLVSIFADLDGFSAYVDECIATNSVSEMVSNIHVIRGELARVLRDDFGGKRVRYIGDCLHGEIASGSATIVDQTQSITDAVLCAGALRSSFELCRNILGVEQLGLAVGVEQGETPITRLGLRGERSVRACASIAVLRSESEQKRCDGSETALGSVGFSRGNASVQNLFQYGSKASNLDYEVATAHLAALSNSPSSGHTSRGARAHMVRRD